MRRGAAAKLHHTNIVPVFGVGEEAGTSYYVMQLIQGADLDELMNELRRIRHNGRMNGKRLLEMSQSPPRMHCQRRRRVEWRCLCGKGSGEGPTRTP